MLGPILPRLDQFDAGHYRNPAYDAQTVTPADNTPLAGGVAKGIYIGGAGNVTVVTAGGTTVTYSAVPAGTHLAVFVQAVNATGTTATNIVAEF